MKTPYKPLNCIKVNSYVELPDGNGGWVEWESVAECYPHDLPQWDEWTNTVTGEVLSHDAFEKLAGSNVNWERENDHAYEKACDIEADRYEAAYERHIDMQIDAARDRAFEERHGLSREPEPVDDY
jgi:hypothetical protein